MEKEEIIDLFLKKGIQLDSDSLEWFYRKQGKIREMLEKIDKKEPKPKTITTETIQFFLKEPKTNIELVKGPVCKKRKTTTQDYVRYLSNRYEKISNLLVKKLSLLNLMSLGKITQKIRNFSVIGMVKDKDNGEKTAIIEDPTGELKISFNEKNLKDFNEIVLDEVLGAICEKRGIVKAKKIVWPDVPLRKNVNKTKQDVFCLFLSDLHINDKKANKNSYEKFLNWVNKTKYTSFYIFVLGDISSEKKDITDFFYNLPKNAFKVFVKGEIDPDTTIWDLILPNPSFIRVENNILALLCHGEFLTNYTDVWKGFTPATVMQTLLKKRHINPTFRANTKIYENDPFLVDIVPDIFVSGHTHKPSLLNYKGVSIMTTGSFITTPIFWLVNLRTRETIKLDFT